MDNLPSLGQLVETLAGAAELAERAATTLAPWTDWWRYPGGHGGLIADVIQALGEPDRFIGRSDRTAIAIDRLWVRQIPSSATAYILNLNHDNVKGYLARTSRPERDEWYAAQIIWQEHCSGRTVLEISRSTGLHRDRVYRLLKRYGSNHLHRTLNSPADEDTISDVIQLYRDGAIYSEIVQRTGLSLSVLKRLLSRLHREGRLPEYGTRPGGRPTKETTP